MIFDSEEQRNIILELLNSATLPGKILDILYVFKQEVVAGTVAKEPLKNREGE